MNCNHLEIKVDNISRIGAKESQDKVVTPSKEKQTIVADSGKVLGKVEIQPIPSEYVVPSGEITITEQGTFNVKDYEKAVVTSPFDSKFDQLINGTLTEVTEEDLAGNTKVNDYAFYNQLYLRDVELADTITTIGTRAFESDTSLYEVKGSGVDTINDYAFYKCSTMKRFVGKNLTTIKSYAFSFASLLEELNVSNVVSVAGNSFSLCGIKKLKFNSLISGVSHYTFGEMSMLRFISFAKYTASMGSAFQGIRTSVTFRWDLIAQMNEPNAYSCAKTIVVNTPNQIALVSTNSSIKCNWYFPLNLLGEYKSATNWNIYANTFYPSVANEQERLALDTTLYTKCYQNDTDSEYWFENGAWVLKYIEGIAQ